MKIYKRIFKKNKNTVETAEINASGDNIRLEEIQAVVVE